MALLPPFFLDAVVAIGTGDDPTDRSWIGTGFLYGDRVDGNNSDKKGPGKYRIWLITNKHVLSTFRNVYLKFNSVEEFTSTDYRVPLISRNGKPLWIGHPADSVDVAAIFLNVSVLKRDQRKFEYFHSDSHVKNKGQMKDERISEGDQVYILGFPMGLVSPERQYVICRGGHLARVRDFIEGKANDYLVDCMVFPGNSGGPVVLCPSAIAIKGTNPVNKADLIGIVKSYLPYRDIAFSAQTKKARISFEENSGLTIVESVDSILETVELATKRMKRRGLQEKYRANKKKQNGE